MDNPLLAIATSQPATIAEVIAALEAIDSLLPDTDGLKWFNWLYLTVTKAVDGNIATGTWHNPAWLTQLDVVFASLYLSALSGWLTPGETAPKCWCVLFDARNDAKLARVQFALAGINAHIDHDLSEAVVETCRQFGIVPVHQSPEYLDYTQVNNILDPIVNQAKAQLLTGLLGDNLPSIGYVENMAAAMRPARLPRSSLDQQRDAFPRRSHSRPGRPFSGWSGRRRCAGGPRPVSAFRRVSYLTAHVSRGTNKYAVALFAGLTSINFLVFHAKLWPKGVI